MGADPNADYAATIPHLAFAAYQMMFAVITPALITGAFVERVRFKTFLVFTLLWATLVYDPGGALGVGRGRLCCASWARWTSPAARWCTSPPASRRWPLPWSSAARTGFRQRHAFEPHNIPYSILGAGLLWLGWFGFNGGSALAANGLAVNALVNTNTAAAAGGLVWMLLSWRDNKPSVLGIVTGAVVGLVAITPAAGYVTPLAAHGHRRAGGARSATTPSACASAARLDESLDVWACHGMGGAWGALATGIFATKAVNPAGADGLFYGNPGAAR